MCTPDSLSQSEARQLAQRFQKQDQKDKLFSALLAQSVLDKEWFPHVLTKAKLGSETFAHLMNTYHQLLDRMKEEDEAQSESDEED